MRRFTLLITLIASTSMTIALDACKEDLDCEALCEEAQDRDCTSIVGDCGEFCAALGNVQDDAECAGARNTYESCVNDKGVCGDGCDEKESTLSTCVTLYCASRLTEADCAVLVESF